MAKDLEAIKQAERSVRSFRNVEWQRPGWTVLAIMLLQVGKTLWTEGDRFPRGVMEGTPLHLFVCQGLGFFGIRRKPSTISAALKNPRLTLDWTRDENEEEGN